MKVRVRVCRARVRKRQGGERPERAKTSVSRGDKAGRGQAVHSKDAESGRVTAGCAGCG